jgi:hypothetical protein
MGEMKGEIETLDEKVTWFNIGINSGEDAGQTIFHWYPSGQDHGEFTFGP